MPLGDKSQNAVAAENCNSETASDDRAALRQSGERQAILKPALSSVEEDKT